MYTQGKRAQHGKPHGVVGDDQPDAGDGQAGHPGVADRSVVPTKPGNAGGGKGPWFKTDATSGKGQEIGQPINSDNSGLQQRIALVSAAELFKLFSLDLLGPASGKSNLKDASRCIQ